MIYIVTTCTRPENLETIKETIPPECVWVVVFDNSIKDSEPADGAINLYSPFTGHWGMSNRNFALDEMEFADEDWIYVLDDDNIIHPDWYEAVKDLNSLELNMINWGQLWDDGSIRLQPAEKPAVDGIDTACYMVRGRLMRSLRYNQQYNADGLLAEQAYGHGGTLKLDSYLAYYNYLRHI
jgi:hypothetical protein